MQYINSLVLSNPQFTWKDFVMEWVKKYDLNKLIEVKAQEYYRKKLRAKASVEKRAPVKPGGEPFGRSNWAVYIPPGETAELKLYYDPGAYQ